MSSNNNPVNIIHREIAGTAIDEASITLTDGVKQENLEVSRSVTTSLNGSKFTTYNLGSGLHNIQYQVSAEKNGQSVSLFNIEANYNTTVNIKSCPKLSTAFGDAIESVLTGQFTPKEAAALLSAKKLLETTAKKHSSEFFDADITLNNLETQSIVQAFNIAEKEGKRGL